ncbi:MAG TPA: bifunctional YncE family protein/alkaline phosphatase family protein [Solirubrobacteraceae bacterium]|nr:bifunctional YncE family protein/alkaline phosphatase family protein [Solirubrobacteraceae bacterium]
MGSRRRGRTVVIATLAATVLLVGIAAAAVSGVGFNPFGNSEVGNSTTGQPNSCPSSSSYVDYSTPPSVLLPTNQWISPFGSRLLDCTERLVSSTISPNGEYMAALGWSDFTGYLTIFNLQTQQMVEQTELKGDAAEDDTTVAADGPLFTPGPSAGTETLWVPQSEFLQKFSFSDATGMATQEASIFLCGTPGATPSNYYCSGYDDAGESSENPTDAPKVAQGAELPSGMALSPDGSKLYVALNGANKLGVIDTTSNAVLGEIPVGNAPRQVVLADGGTVAYVSNEGGRPAGQRDHCTNLSDGTPIVSNCSTGGARTGTVSVVHLTPSCSPTCGQESQEIRTGLEPTALYQDGSALFVANSNDDSLSVIDEKSNTVTQKVDTNPVPGASVGSYANAISMSDPSHVLVSIGRDNAIAVYKYKNLYAPMKFLGLIPTDFYPVQVQPDSALGKIVVTSDKGIGARGPINTAPKNNKCYAWAGCVNKGQYAPPTCTSTAGCNAYGYNTYMDTGSVNTFAMPSDSQLPQLTNTVFSDNAWNQIKPINQGDYDTVPAVIPKRLGDPSPIKHIVVIVKENRTYDQVLGDLGEGNGDPADAQFGQQITPNFHALARRFGDLDNFYDEGTLSADGHNWIVQAEANDYVEKEFGAFYRSYPSQGGDALAYQRDGFLWNAAEKAGLSVQNFGEYIYNPYSLPAGSPDWDQWYAESQWLEGKQSGPEPISDPCQYTRVQSDIPSLQAISDPCFPNFQLAIPDQYRVDQWLPVFKQQERSGRMPNLSFMWLMTDHTGTTGVASGQKVPIPVAQVADNDLAVGRVVDAISHSRFWRSTAIFVDEDDTQNGVDHVDGHRAPTFVISPYSASGVDDQYYTQLNMVKTIEQILGIRPMNQEDEAAEPMYAAFTDHPSWDAFQAYDAQPNEVPLNLGAGGPNDPTTWTAPPAGATPAERKAFKPQGVVPASMRSVHAAWESWLRVQGKEGHFNGPDKVNPAQMNRFDWYSAHNWEVAYPGDPKIYMPNQVPGRNLPAAFIGNG